MDLVRSLEDVHKLFTVENRFCVEQAASWLPPTRSEGEEEELAAPLLDGYKVSFHLGDLKMSQICELYNLTVDTPHDHCKMLVLHLVLDEEQVAQLKGIDEAVKSCEGRVQGDYSGYAMDWASPNLQGRKDSSCGPSA